MLNESLLKILVIDDNHDDLGIISRFIGRCSREAEIDWARTGEEALESLNRKKYDLSFLDLRLPDVDGLELLRGLTRAEHDMPVIMVTGQGDEKVAVSAMKSGAYDYIVKDDLTVELLAKTIAHALEKRKLAEEKVALERELARYTSRLEEMVAERTAEVDRSRRLAVMGEISAHMAHEVRQPLVALKLACNLFTRRHTLDPREQKVIEIMKSATTTLESLVHDILDFSRPATLNLEVADIGEVTAGTIGEMDLARDNKDIAIEKMFPRERIITLLDVLRFKSILKNLISNAMQAIASAGTVTVSVSADAQTGEVSLRVSDTGQGIPEENLPKIFDSFFTTRKGGTGVGMCIVKKFVEAHGGTIAVESEVGRGTVVTVTLPLSSPASDPAFQAPASDETAVIS